jgi:hypothetical protein
MLAIELDFPHPTVASEDEAVAKSVDYLRGLVAAL